MVQGIVGFLAVGSWCLYLFFSTFGFTSGIGLESISIPILVASALLTIGTLLKFRIWVPAAVGGGLGLLAAVGYIVWFLIVSLFVGFAASGANGG